VTLDVLKGSLKNVSLISLLVLTGCGGSSDSDDSDESTGLSSFSLQYINSANSRNDDGSGDIKKMELIWYSASDESGVTYSVCEKDTTQANDCNLLTSVTDSLSATVSVSSLIDALSTEYFIMASKGDETVFSDEQSPSTDTVNDMIGFIKASNTGDYDNFGLAVALSDDGSTLAIGAFGEDSADTGVNTDTATSGTDDDASGAGAVYLFTHDGSTWQQSAYIKASNSETNDYFAYALSLNEDGTVLAVGAYGEDSDDTGVISVSANAGLDNDASDSGAVYLFSQSDETWSQTAYIKASNTGGDDNFGYALSLSNDGTRLAVGALDEDSDDTGVNTDTATSGLDDNISRSGAVYLFTHSDNNWSQTAYFKASNPGNTDVFGRALSLSGDGYTLVVGADNERSDDVGINTDSATSGLDDDADSAGAVYVFTETGGVWSQEAYVKASNSDEDDSFGYAVDVNGDGSVMVVGAFGEASDDTGINTDSATSGLDYLASNSGAVYLFNKTEGEWSQDAFIKSSNSEQEDSFGVSLALSDDGQSLLVEANAEDSDDTGINTNTLASGIDDNYTDDGAVYLFSEVEGVWAQTAYIKASNAGITDEKHQSLTLSSDGSILVIGDYDNASSSTGINGEDDVEVNDDNYHLYPGAVYIY